MDYITLDSDDEDIIVPPSGNKTVVPGGAGGAMVPPDFGRSVNPISEEIPIAVLRRASDKEVRPKSVKVNTISTREG